MTLIKYPQTLEDLLNERIEIITHSNIDSEKSIVHTENLPTFVYTPAQAMILAEAYKKLKTLKRSSKDYKDAVKTIEHYYETLSNLESEIIESKKSSDAENLELLKKSKEYMNAIDDYARALADKLIEIDKEFDDYFEKENLRYKKKLSKLEYYKNQDIRRVVENKSISRKTLRVLFKIMPSVTAAVAAYNMPVEDYLKGILAMVAGTVSYTHLTLPTN